MDNKQSVNNHPLKFPSHEDLQTAINGYFDMCDSKKKPYTITGLCLCLETTRQTLINYEQCIELDWLKRLDDAAKASYIDTIKRAKLRCENYAEEQLLDPTSKKSPIGSIFALKNYGWADRQEIVTTNNNINISLEDEDNK